MIKIALLSVVALFAAVNVQASMAQSCDGSPLAQLMTLLNSKGQQPHAIACYVVGQSCYYDSDCCSNYCYPGRRVCR